MKDGDEMAEVFHDHPSAVSNTLEIAERCNLELGRPGDYHLPEFQVPDGHNARAGARALNSRGRGCANGSALSSPTSPSRSKHLATYEKRMEHELDVDREHGLRGLLPDRRTSSDFAREAGRFRSGPAAARRRAASWPIALGITGIDPIEYDIIFERFLNPERISMPDIDVDFCMKRARRGDPLRRRQVQRGRTVTRASASPRSSPSASCRRGPSIRDVGRVLGMPYGDVDRIAKLVPETLGISLEEALEQSPELRARVESDGSRLPSSVETRPRLEGLTRHASTHAAGRRDREPSR